MSVTIQEISDILSADAFGELNLPVSGIATPNVAKKYHLALAMSHRYAADVSNGEAQSALISKDINWNKLGINSKISNDAILKFLNVKSAIVVSKPRIALAKLSSMFDTRSKPLPGIHPLACVDENANLGERTSIGSFSVIGSGVEMGTGCVVASNCTIGNNAVIGNDAIIHPGVRIMHNVKIGDRVIIHANAVIGSDGFSFATEGIDRVETARTTLGNVPKSEDISLHRIHSLGDVQIGNDVEIGAGTAIDRGTLDSTFIGDGTKLDNQVHIGHNVKIGRNCRICGQVGIAGSAVIGDRVVLGGQCGVSDHKRIGNDVISAGASNLYRNVPDGKSVMGSPALEMSENIKLNVIIRNLPKTLRRIKLLEKNLGLGKKPQS